MRELFLKMCYSTYVDLVSKPPSQSFRTYLVVIDNICNDIIQLS